MSDPNINNDSGVPDDVINSALQHHAATAHQQGSACCGAQTSYIHVYQHAATCVSAQAHGAENNGPLCFNPDGGLNSLVNRLPAFDTASSGAASPGESSNNPPVVVSLQSIFEKATRAVIGTKKTEVCDIQTKIDARTACDRHSRNSIARPTNSRLLTKKRILKVISLHL